MCLTKFTYGLCDTNNSISCRNLTNELQQGLFQDYGQGRAKRDVMGYWGAKRYNPPGSEHTFDKL